MKLLIFSIVFTLIVFGSVSPIFASSQKSYIQSEPNTAVFQSSIGQPYPQFFYQPMGITLDKSGNLYVVDVDNGIRKFSPYGPLISKFMPKGLENNRGPTGIALDSRGYMYVTNNWSNRIEVYSPDGKYVSSMGESGSGKSQLSFPTFIKIDKADNIYVVDANNDRIVKFSSDGKFISQIGPFSYNNIPWSFGGLAIDNSGNIYTTMYRANVTLAGRFNPTMNALFYFGVSTRNNSPFGNPVTPGPLGSPGGIAVDSKNNVYVLDTHYNTVEKFSPAGVCLSQFGQFGSDAGEFWLASLSDIIIDKSDGIYISDTNNNRIEKFVPSSGQALPCKHQPQTAIPDKLADFDSKIKQAKANPQIINIKVFNRTENEISPISYQLVANTPWLVNEQLNLKIESAIHGFGGMYRDENGKLNIYTTDHTIKSIPSSTMFFLHLYDQSYNGTVVKYSSHSRHKWIEVEYIMNKIWDDKSIGITMSGIDDKGQKFTIGVSKLNATTTQKINKFLDDHKIPRDLIEIQQMVVQPL